MLKQIFHPLGYPVEIASDSEIALRAACGLWSTWPALFERAGSDAAPLRIEVRVHKGAVPTRPPRFENPARFVCDPINFAEFNIGSRSGLISISESALASICFRHHFLEALALTALDAIFFTPLHAACVASDRVGVLLCGDSGAGKSSLAYACAQRGWTLVSDDAVHLAPGPERIGVGGSNIIHLREPARELFDALGGLRAARMPNGKQAIEIDAAAHGFRTARHATIGPCVFLERRPGPPCWSDFSKDAAIAYFLKYVAPRDTSRAEAHLREFLDSTPRLLRYEHAGEAAEALDCLVEAAA